MSNSLLNQMGGALMEQISQEWEKIVPEIKELRAEIKKFGDEFTKKNVTVMNEEFLNKERFFAIVREKKVKGANEVCVWRKDTGEGDKFVYVAYAKDRELLEEDKNMFVNIKFKFIGQDLEEIFEGKELIILK